jgi:hypothetical protein
LYFIVKRYGAAFEQVPDSPVFEQEDEAWTWAKRHLAAHRSAFEPGKVAIGVFRELDSSSLVPVI